MNMVLDPSAKAIQPASVKLASHSNPSQASRIHYLDNLRAVAMLLGVYLHAALAYAQPAQSVWLATDSKSSVAIDASIWFIHLFRMGLFFMLSGYFAKLVMVRKGFDHFAWSRSLRIVGPFVLFYPFLLAAMAVVIVFSLAYVVEPRGLRGMIAEATKGSGGGKKADPPGTMHLWFLYYLAAFTLITAVLNRQSWLSLDGWSRALNWRSGWLFLCPLLLIPGAAAGGSPLAAPESFLPSLWPFGFYGLFYLAGWRLFGREAFLDRWRPYLWPLMLACLSLFVPYYFLMPVLELDSIVAGASPQPIWKQAITAFLTAYLSVALTMVSLLLGQRFLSGKSSLLSFVADASYWVYLVHLPIVIFLQTILVPFDWPVWLKLILVLLGTMMPCMATYVVFVRYTPIGWMLHGKRTFP
jgi:peptidoglycan/LPS O-acetylase OafA/YrhL